jgi:nitrous oxide reductase accessory protein NosL
MPSFPAACCQAEKVLAVLLTPEQIQGANLVKVSVMDREIFSE